MKYFTRTLTALKTGKLLLTNSRDFTTHNTRLACPCSDVCIACANDLIHISIRKTGVQWQTYHCLMNILSYRITLIVPFPVSMLLVRRNRIVDKRTYAFFCHMCLE